MNDSIKLVTKVQKELKRWHPTLPQDFCDDIRQMSAKHLEMNTKLLAKSEEYKNQWSLDQRKSLDEKQKQILEIGKEFGLLTTKICSIINGGAAISILTFIGNIGKSKPQQSLVLANGSSLVDALFWFSVGVGIVPLIGLMVYFSMFSVGEANDIQEKGRKKTGWMFSHYICLALGLLICFASIGSFSWGIRIIKSVFTLW